MEQVILYGAPHSLYTGKTRSYLRKQGIAYVERAADPRFRAEIVPAIGRAIIPVVALPDGTIVQDTADILDHFERAGVRVSAYPAGPRQRILAHIAELYAVVVLTRHAMHYRWSYAGEQERFLIYAFAGGSGDTDAVMARMRSYLPMLGVTPATIAAIEESYLSLLDLLEAHFAAHPYLLGGQPSIGDYGLFGPLFAHLGRDPAPADIMKRRAPKVFRWVERMNAPDPDLPEYGDYTPAFLPGDEIPGTLTPLFRHMADELFPELTDKVAMMCRYVAEVDPQEGAPVTDKPHRRVIGSVETAFRGVGFDSGVQPYIFYLWQRITDAFDALAAPEAKEARDWLERVGLAPLLDARRPIRVERRNHIEVWGRRL
ncbi:glutathione S-transferase family protein [Sphingomonas sp. IC4-52]|uniref:glutathione S-transferase family protein n=1 Tax=Sphingomonas sp. IC4-52 TaxID=2887202 RepID=UPI001D12C393|nr:glutathione S-transferase family protein [Sphingomonas sp. IC4-52]MCC2981086.1 glutathione S-transferase family protein [Sphingomonas sp. IC4-52]